MQKAIRQFLYLDTHHLYSFYSQVKDGIPGIIFTERKSVDGGESKAKLSSGLVQEISRNSEEVRESASKTLHDNMYNDLEAELLTQNSIVDINQNYNKTQLLKPEVREDIQTKLLIKVTGSAVLDNYEFLRRITGKFNELIAFVTYLPLVSKFASFREIPLKEIEKIQDQKQRKIIMAFRARDLDKLAELLDNKLDEVALKAVAFVIDNFHENLSFLSVQPFEGLDAPIFSAPMNPAWLRDQANMLRLWYGRKLKFKLTLVGQVGMVHQQADQEELEESPPTDPEKRTVADSLKELIPKLETMAKHFYGDKYPTITVVPLAIYREFVSSD